MKPVYIAFLVQGCAGLALLLLTVSVYLQRGRHAALRTFLLMTHCASAWVLSDALRLYCAFAGGPTATLSTIGGMLVVSIGWAVLHFSLRYPDTAPPRWARTMEWIFGALALPVALLTLRGDWVFDRRI